MLIEKNSTNKKKASPKWTTYFSGSPKRQKVILKIIFYAQNPKKTCYATLKTISLKTKVHINTVYDAVKIACSIGILKKEEVIEVYQNHPLTGKPFFNKNIKLIYLGDTPNTAGEVYFGKPISDSTVGQKRDKSRGYIKNKELSKERGKKTLKHSCSYKLSSQEKIKIQENKEPKLLKPFRDSLNIFKEKNLKEFKLLQEEKREFISPLYRKNLDKHISYEEKEAYPSIHLENILSQVTTPKTRDILLILEERRNSTFNGIS